MNRPTTRSKNKRQKANHDGGTTAEILRKIHLTGEISPDDICKLYMIWKPICQGCRVNSKDNPNCFCGLIPPPNGNRKSGLWQKISDIILALGPDPCNDLRASTKIPAGLTNLGATCYANSILQCLYMNTSFRAGVFSVEPDILKQHPVLDQLARLFARLHSSKMAFVDSAPFIKTLDLDNGVQQDSHEFLTLLLSLLERSLSHSKTSKARTIVQDLFRGSVSHVTRCSKCGKDSDASSKMEDFYELELNIKGLKSLDESLDDYLSVENLQEDNQYFCESCGTRVDATRSIKLRTLPDVLNLQLKRCVFLPKTTTKKKITSVFSFPGELDMKQRLSEPAQSDLIYDLSAVLIHKGTAVNSGHYIAHIKDERTGNWWEFDDEHVSKLGDHPFGERSSRSSAKSEQMPTVPLSFTRPIDAASNGSHDNADFQSSLDFVAGNHAEIFSSADAYMLMYNRRNTGKGSENPCTEYGANNMELDENLLSDHNDSLLPHYLDKEMEELNASYLDACKQYNLKKDREVKNITERRQEVRSVLSEAPVHSVEEPYFWIYTDWLRQWADNIIPPVLDNLPIQCSHGKVPASKVVSMKRLSSIAWTKLISKYKGGPTLSKDEYCINCLRDGADTTARADNYRDQRVSMKELAEAALAGKCLEGTLYFVSRAWLLQWLRRKNVDSPCEADAGPTASIRCPHGELMPDGASGAKRVLVPESLWLFFLESANAVKPDDPLGCSTFPSDSEACALCCVELSEVACFEDSLREAKLKQRQNHEKLVQGKGIALSPGCKYYLLPSSWLTKWRSYITTNGKNLSSSVEPERLNGVIDMLKCEKHSRLLERPPELSCKRGVITQRMSPTDGLTIITGNDWKFFCQEWDCTEEKGITAEVECINCKTTNLFDLCEEMPISEGNLSPSHNDGSDVFESRRPIIKTYPEVCEECIGERESCELMQKLNYYDKDICIFLVHGKEAPKSILEASGTILEPDRRTSKRSRKTSFGNSVNVKVSGSTSIYQLKMMIWELFGVVKENQILHKGSRVIDGESATLADMNIFPGDVLWVTDSEIHENRDIADELSEQKTEVQSAEEGFRGTLLTSCIIPQFLVQGQ